MNCKKCSKQCKVRRVFEQYSEYNGEKIYRVIYDCPNWNGDIIEPEHSHIVIFENSGGERVRKHEFIVES